MVNGGQRRRAHSKCKRCVSGGASGPTSLPRAPSPPARRHPHRSRSSGGLSSASRVPGDRGNAALRDSRSAERRCRRLPVRPETESGLSAAAQPPDYWTAGRPVRNKRTCWRRQLDNRRPLRAKKAGMIPVEGSAGLRR